MNTPFPHHQAEQAALRAAMERIRARNHYAVAQALIQKARDASYGWPVLQGGAK